MAGGAEHRLHGWQLPEEQPVRVLGVNVDWVSDSGDVLRLA